MKKILYNFIFNRTKKLNRNGEGLIQIRAYQNGKNRYFTTEIYVKPNQWDNRRNKIKNHPNDFILNKRIREQLEKLQTFEIDQINHHGFCAIDELKMFVESRGMPTFIEFYQSELESNRLSASSKQAQLNTLNKLLEYRKNIYFRDLNFRLIDGFDGYLRKSKLSDTTIAKHHKDLRKFINLAIKKDYLDINKNPYKKFKVKKGQSKPRTFLTMPEIERLELLEFDWTEAHLEVIRDAFLFGVFTGLRFGDLVRVSKENIIEGERGLSLKMQAQKTKKHSDLPLYNLFKVPGQKSKPGSIILKYQERHQKKYFNHPAYDDEPFFKDLSNQYFNRELKVLASRANIKKELTAHVARHTFGTHLATKVKPAILQKLMQHSKIQTTMIYVHLSKQLIDNELDKVDWN